MSEFNEPGATLVFVVTIALSLLGLFRAPQLIDACLFRPYYLRRRGQYHTIVSSGFVHADLGHLLFNMFTFFFFAFPLERLFGTTYFLALYMFGLVVSHGCTYFKQRENTLYASLGASGAISAVLFAYIVYFPTTTLVLFPIPVPSPRSPSRRSRWGLSPRGFPSRPSSGSACGSSACARISRPWASTDPDSRRAGPWGTSSSPS